MIWVKGLVITLACVNLVYALTLINRMSKNTNHAIRFAYVLIASGVLGEMLAILAGYTPGLPESLIIFGFGSLHLLTRRCVIRPRFENADDGKSTA